MLKPEEFCKALIGLKEPGAKQLCKTYGKTYRVVLRNGKPTGVKVLPFDGNRVNLVIVAGKVNQASRG
jgi:hypothetical protein